MKKTAAAILAAGFAAASLLPAAACASKGQEQFLEGTYVLESATLDGVDCTDDFLFCEGETGSERKALHERGIFICDRTETGLIFRKECKCVRFL